MARTPSSTQELLDASRIERDAVVLADGGLRKILMVSGLNFELKSEDEQNIAVAGYQNLLNGLDFPIQVLIHSRKVNVDAYIEGLANIESREENRALAGLVRDYRSFVSSLVAANPIMEKRFLVIVPRDPSFGSDSPAATQAIARIISGTKNAPDGTMTIEPQAFTELELRADQVISSLSQMGLRAVPLLKDEIVELFHNLMNPETVERKISA